MRRDDPESVPIRFAYLRKMERACQGIRAITRIAGLAQHGQPWPPLRRALSKLYIHMPPSLIAVKIHGVPIASSNTQDFAAAACFRSVLLPLPRQSTR